LLNWVSLKVSNPPAFGSKIASTILGSQDLEKAWYDDLNTMSGRIREMRNKLFDELVKCGTLQPTIWSRACLII